MSEKFENKRCGEVRNNMPGYCEGNLPDDLMKKISDHISQCRACATEESFHRKTWDLLGSWTEIEPHHLYRARFWKKEAEQKSLSNIIAHLKSVLIPALCIILLVISAALFIPSHNCTDNSSTAEMKQWKPMDWITHSDMINYQLAHGKDMDRLIARIDVILTVPEYLDDTVESESTFYPDIPLGDAGVSVLEGAKSVITELEEGAL